MVKLYAYLILGLIMVSVLVGCTRTETLYVCPEGKTVIAKDMCKTNKVAAVEKKDAERYAQNFVKGYFAAYGGKIQLVSTHLKPDEGDYYSTFVATWDDLPYETTVVVDGLTGEVRCSENCEYVPLE